MPEFQTKATIGILWAPAGRKLPLPWVDPGDQAATRQQDVSPLTAGSVSPDIFIATFQLSLPAPALPASRGPGPTTTTFETLRAQSS